MDAGGAFFVGEPIVGPLGWIEGVAAGEPELTEAGVESGAIMVEKGRTEGMELHIVQPAPLAIERIERAVERGSEAGRRWRGLGLDGWSSGGSARRDEVLEPEQHPCIVSAHRPESGREFCGLER